MYYKDLTELKGTLIIGPNCNIKKIQRNEIRFIDEEKNKPYMLIQPGTSDINIAEEKKKGHNHDIDDWLAKINEVAGWVQE